MAGDEGDPMNLRHVALVYASEEQADRFLLDVLGLAKSEPKKLARGIAQALFGVDSELEIVNYASDQVHFEVFIDLEHRPRAGRIEHVCLEVEDLPAFLQRCSEAGAEVVRVPKGDSWLTFVRDAGANLFEIKERV